LIRLQIEAITCPTRFDVVQKLHLDDKMMAALLKKCGLWRYLYVTLTRRATVIDPAFVPTQTSATTAAL